MTKTLFSTLSYIYVLFVICFTANGNSIFLRSGFGLSTYKSVVVESNDTNRTIGYEFGISSGSENQWRMKFSREQATTNFIYADSTEKSKIDYVCDDIILNYQFGWFLLGPVFSYWDLKAKKKDVEWTQMMNRNYGFYFGLEIPSGRTTEFFIDMIYTLPQNTVDKLKDGKIASRQEYFAGGRFAFGHKLWGVIGYKNRSLSVTLNSKKDIEQQTMTWIGLQAQHDF